MIEEELLELEDERKRDTALEDRLYERMQQRFEACRNLNKKQEFVLDTFIMDASEIFGESQQRIKKIVQKILHEHEEEMHGDGTVVSCTAYQHKCKGEGCKAAYSSVLAKCPGCGKARE